jgi:TrmH family RNA methyltransferase
MLSISSPHNERVKLVRLLQRQAKTRRQQQRLVLEGVRLVDDVLKTGVRPDFICYTSDDAAIYDLLERCRADGVPCLQVTGDLMRDMADTETPQGILGVFPWPELPIPAAPELVLVADGWRDPGNLGTIIRTAAAAGVDLVALAPGTVDPFNPKTIRAGMGAQYRVPIRILGWDELAALLAGMPVYLAETSGDLLYDAVDWTRPSAAVVGGEAHGFGQAARQIPHTSIRIPMAAGAESLNAAVAASILIYEACRQRGW